MKKSIPRAGRGGDGTEIDNGASKPKVRMTHASAIRLSLENNILSGELRPGSPIDEEDLASRFGVSRTPIREAMLQLQQSGLIEKQPRRNATVAKLDLPRLVHMFEAVSELEALCARLAANRITKREGEEMRRVQELTAQALADGRRADYARYGRKFHTLIMNATHNSVLIETVSKLALHTLTYRRFQLTRPGYSEQNLEFHREIMEAVISGDGDKAFEMMRSHVTLSGNVLADFISMGEGSQVDEYNKATA
jgi:DNA-binding GntR family transcriptional regulator